MPASAVTLTASSSQAILAADPNRDHYTLQLLTDDDPVFLAFGEDAADATGICLFYPGCSVRVTGPKARLAANGYSGQTPTIGIETMEDIVYQMGQFLGPWPVS